MNYLPITEPGTVRKRANRVEMNNQYGGSPSIVWIEEDQILLADGTYKYANAGMLLNVIDEEALSETFPMIDPDTGQEIRMMTGQELMLAVQSYYVFRARKRDAENASVAMPTGQG
ncbi:hypothetical protein HNP33_003054 [Comamonas odontotermitis]|uniref:Uncharacterized protein n=1 Tax=Comamonas odontotermitis TaxID=379895 RepID=A0ABR6RIU7_9BURK|nr:hypothetical protein [Comamonas odontotermitis]MBB6578949.1 hypothetical protein [Comamonas odontotermitis]